MLLRPENQKIFLLLTFASLYRCGFCRPGDFRSPDCSDPANYIEVAENIRSELYSLISEKPCTQAIETALCSRDISFKKCGSGLDDVSRSLGNLKPQVVSTDLCLFGHLDGRQSLHCRYNTSVITHLKNLSATASSPIKSLLTIGDGDMHLGSESRAFALVECRRGSSPSDCTSCLKSAVTQAQQYCEKSESVPQSNCVVWCGIYQPLPPPDGIPSPDRVPSPPVSPSTSKPSWSKEYRVPIALAAVAFSIMLACVAVCCLPIRTKEMENHRVAPDSGNAAVTKFDLNTIIAATSNFSDENKLKEEKFAHYYKGDMLDGMKVIVKRLSTNSRQAMKHFMNEVVLVARLRHRNLVKFLGYCVEGDEKLLVYEFVSDKSLDYILDDAEKLGQIGWDARFQIIKGIAQGLLYLHTESPLGVVHHDLQASNVFLDSELCPKISGFGLARSSCKNQRNGTYGFLAPEIDKLPLKSDIFAFGFLAIEIVKGGNRVGLTQPQEPDLLHDTWMQWKDGKVLQLMDPALTESCSVTEVLRCIHVALLCVQENPAQRPTMSHVSRMLNGETIQAEPNPPPTLISMGL